MRIKEFIQTPFISHENKNLINVYIEDWDGCNSYFVEAFIDGKDVFSKNIFAPSFEFLIPLPKNNTECIIRITPFEDTPVKYRYTLSKPREWKIPVLYSSHEDIGYCGYVKKLPFDLYDGLKKVMSLCRKYPDFKYTIEHYWWLKSFLDFASQEEKDELKKLFAEKRIDFSPMHSGIHTEWASPEQLVRSIYPACINAKEQYGVKPTTAVFADLSGMSASCAEVYANAGIKYFCILPNSFRNCKTKKDFPTLFTLKSPSENHSVICMYQRYYRPEELVDIWCDTLRQYPEGEYTFDSTKMRKTEDWFTNKLNSVKTPVIDIHPISFYDDRETPTTMLITAFSELNKKWKYPRFKLEIPSLFFKEIEKYKDLLPQFSGEIPDQWADFATIAPNWMSKKRASLRALYNAEILSTITGNYSNTLFTECMWDLCTFDEHCWATSSKHPVAMHKENLVLTKKDTAYNTLHKLNSFTEKICSIPSENLSITSTLPQKRERRIRCSKDSYIPKNCRHQILSDNTVITSKLDFDGISTKKYEGILPTATAYEISTDIIETPYYKVKIDLESKTLANIYDKELERNLLFDNSKFELGQFIYTYSESKTTDILSYETPHKLDLKIHHGDIAYIIEQTGLEEQSNANVTTRIIFYKDDKTIDLDISYKNAYGMAGDFYDRYKKNYFFSFPFCVDNPEFYTESQCCIINEKTGKLEINARDFSATVNWIAVENSDYGIAIHSEDAPIFHSGDIKYNKFDSEFKYTDSQCYLYAASNRCNSLVYEQDKDFSSSFCFSVIPYSGSHKNIVPKWSANIERKLILGSNLPEKTYLKINADNLKLSVIKVAENDDNSIIIRFTETCGLSGNAQIYLPFTPKSAYSCDVLENILSPLECNNGIISFGYDKYSYITIRVNL